MSVAGDELESLLSESLNLDAPNQLHVDALTLFINAPGNTDALYSLVGDHHFIEAMALVEGLDDRELSAWLRIFWSVAEKSVQVEMWGPRLLWNARRMAGDFPEFARTLFDLTKAWSALPLTAEALEGPWNTSLDADDIREPRLFLEFAIRAALEADGVTNLSHAGWSVPGGDVLRYVLTHGSIQTFSDLAEAVEDAGETLGFGKPELAAVQRRIESGTYSYRGMEREDVQAELDGWSEVLSHKERDLLRAALGETRDGPRKVTI